MDSSKIQSNAGAMNPQQSETALTDTSEAIEPEPDDKQQQVHFASPITNYLTDTALSWLNTPNVEQIARQLLSVLSTDRIQKLISLLQAGINKASQKLPQNHLANTVVTTVASNLLKIQNQNQSNTSVSNNNSNKSHNSNNTNNTDTESKDDYNNNTTTNNNDLIINNNRHNMYSDDTETKEHVVNGNNNNNNNVSVDADLANMENGNSNSNNVYPRSPGAMTAHLSIGSGQTGVSSVAPAMNVNDPLIVMLGIAEYEDFPNLPGVVKDYGNIISTFVNEWQYKVFYRLADNSIVYSNDSDELGINIKQGSENGNESKEENEESKENKDSKDSKDSNNDKKHDEDTNSHEFKEVEKSQDSMNMYRRDSGGSDKSDSMGGSGKSNYKLKWTMDEIAVFLEQARECIVKNNHNGLLFAISGHGDTGKILYDSECEKIELDSIFSMFSPDARVLLETYEETEKESIKLLPIPKIFLLDCCRGDTTAKVSYVDKNTISNNDNNNNNNNNNTNNNNENDDNEDEKDEKIDRQLPQAFSFSEDDSQILKSPPDFLDSPNADGVDADFARSSSLLELPSTQKSASINSQESWSFRTISKQQSQKLFAQMVNFCKLYANIEGYAVADGTANGGLFLRNVCKLFSDTTFVSTHLWNEIILKIREYTKRDATLIGLINFTQLVENEGTLERRVTFGSKYLNIVPSGYHAAAIKQHSMNMNMNMNISHKKTFSVDHLHFGQIHLDDLHESQLQTVLEQPQSIFQMISHSMFDVSDNEMEFESTQIRITNVSKTNNIAVLIEMEPNRENRKNLLQSLAQDKSTSYQLFKKNKFMIIGKNGHNYSREKLWDSFYITLFELNVQQPNYHKNNLDGKPSINSNKSNHSNNSDSKSNYHRQIYERRLFHSDDLYFYKNELHSIEDLLPKCNVNPKETHSLKPIVIVENIKNNNNSQNPSHYCSMCRLRIEFGKYSYYCQSCKHSLCKKCCLLVIFNKTPLSLDIPAKITNVEQTSLSTFEITSELSQKMADTLKQQILHPNNSNNNFNNNPNIPNSKVNMHHTNDKAQIALKYQIKSVLTNNKSTIMPLPTYRYPVDIFKTRTKLKIHLPNGVEQRFKESTVYVKSRITLLDVLNNIELELQAIPFHFAPIKLDCFYKCTFTTLNGIGRFGPTSTDEYRGNLAQFRDTRLDNENEGIQLWRVPQTGKWKVICYGAKGGNVISQQTKKRLFGGKGAVVGGTITLYKNDIIKILCGQMGESYNGNEKHGSGGGGGTYFVLFKYGENNPNINKKNRQKSKNIVNKPILIAAGGNGAHNALFNSARGIDGLHFQSENRTNYCGYKSGPGAARGASFSDDFSNFKSYGDGLLTMFQKKWNPKSFLDGAEGGAKLNIYSCDGGFGGGGASDFAGGGGGGYIGGLVQIVDKTNTNSNVLNGGDKGARAVGKLCGALSYNGCDNNDEKIDVSGQNNGNGKVEVTLISLDG